MDDAAIAGKICRGIYTAFKKNLKSFLTKTKDLINLQLKYRHVSQIEWVFSQRR